MVQSTLHTVSFTGVKFFTYILGACLHGSILNSPSTYLLTTVYKAKCFICVHYDLFKQFEMSQALSQHTDLCEMDFNRI